MNALFHSDLLNFGTIIIAVMIVGEVVVALTICAESLRSIHRRKADEEDEQTGPLGPKPNEPQGKDLPKSA